MLGPAKSRRLDDPITVSLEDLVPRDNFSRHLEAKLDLRSPGDGRSGQRLGCCSAATGPACRVGPGHWSLFSTT